MLMVEHPYFDFCETLYHDFLQQGLHLDSRLSSFFQLDYLPEPYLLFGDQSKPLIILTTNPGAGMPHQHRTEILAGKSPMKADASYREVAAHLGDWYLLNLKGPARRRIDSMTYLAATLGFSGVMQAEAIFFHSPDLDMVKKRKYIRYYKSDQILNVYGQLIRDFLKYKPTISLSAINPRSPIRLDSIQSKQWITWLSSLISFKLDQAQFKSILGTEDNPSCGLLYTPASMNWKAIVVMKGSNQFPAKAGLDLICSHLQQ